MSFLGADFGRRGTVIRMSTGDLLIHSMAPFTAGDATDIRELGNPSWLVEATEFHDTFSRKAAKFSTMCPISLPRELPRRSTAYRWSR